MSSIELHAGERFVEWHRSAFSTAFGMHPNKTVKNN